MNNSTAWALTAIVGLGVGALSYWLIENPLLSGTLAVVYATCTRLTTDYASVLPGEIKGDEWETTRWSVAFIVLVMGASLFGISATLPISLELRFAFQMLVFGIGEAGLLFGVAMTRSQLDSKNSVRQISEESRNENNLSS